MHTLAIISPYIRLAHDFRDARGMNMRPAAICDHALHYFATGSGRYTAKGQEIEIRPGRLMLVGPDEPIAIRADSDRDCRMLNIHLDLVEREDSESIAWPYLRADEQRAPGLVPFPSSFPLFVDIPDSRSYEAAFHAVYQYFQSSDPVSRLKIKAAAINLLALVLQESAKASDATVTSVGRQAVRLGIQYMRANIGEHCTLEEIASASGLSRSHFSVVFRSQIGQSPLQYQLRLRIDEARVLLETTDRAIKEIAASVGFASIHHFSRAFRAATGGAPAQYRATRRGEP